MQTPAQITTLLKANLNDVRMHSTCLFLKDLIERKNPEPGVNRYRIKNIATSTFIESVDAFIAAIDSSFIMQSYPYAGERLSGDRVTGFEITPMNLVVEFHKDSGEDDRYHSGPVYLGLVTFYMAYMNDMDNTVPLKISSVRLVVTDR